MQEVSLSKSHLADFISNLADINPLFGPVALECGQFKFDRIDSFEQLALDYIPTILPAKKYFMPAEETLLIYQRGEKQQGQAVAEVEEQIIFGLHTCDLAGIQCLNTVFSERPKDLNYLVRKKYLTLIGLECNDYCDRFACCALLHNHLPKGGYDLFFTELDSCYIVHINTVKGEQLVDGFKHFRDATEQHRQQLAALRALKKERFRSELAIRYQDLPRLFTETGDSEVWRKVGERCLSCGNCTMVCPTCYCFDIRDETSLHQDRGRRVRIWDSCQHESFARVAGGESFREERNDRQRHRFQRKFNYPMNHYGRIFCTGCGRCSRSCMADIDLKQTINALMEERG